MSNNLNYTTDELAHINAPQGGTRADGRLIDDPARNAVFEAALAGAPHAVQLMFWNLMDNGNIGSDDPIDILVYAHQHPAVMAAPGTAIWSDAEIIEILTDAAEIDKVTGRALGHHENMRLDQRDMIRKALKR